MMNSPGANRSSRTSQTVDSGGAGSRPRVGKMSRLVSCSSTCFGSWVVKTKQPVTCNSVCVYVASLPRSVTPPDLGGVSTPLPEFLPF